MRYDQSILEVIMSCTTKTQDGDGLSSATKLQAELVPSKDASNMEISNKSNSTLPIPMIPEDDFDESEEGFPLITSVFSLASESSDSQKSPGKESTEVASSNDKSPSGSVATSGSPTPNGDLRLLTPSKQKPTIVENKTGQGRDNAPFYVGKGKLILPKPKVEDNKAQSTLPQSTMAFSQMMSFSPQNNNAIKSTANNAGKESTGQGSGVMTRSASKINSQPSGQVVSSVPAIAAPVYHTQSIPATSAASQPKPQVNLANTVQFVNVKSASGQATFPVVTPQTSALSSSVLSSSSPLVKLIKSISPNSTLTNVNVTPAATVTSTTHAPVVVAPVAATPATAQVRTQRHITIAPAPVRQVIATKHPVNTNNTTRFVVVPNAAVSTSTVPGTQVVATKGGVNMPRVVMVPSNATPQVNAPTTQVLYLVENQVAGDGKTFKILIPERKVAGQTATTVPSQNPLNIVSTNNATILSPTQLVRIIPKPINTSTVNQQAKIPMATQTSSPTVVNLSVSTAAPVLSTGGSKVVSTEVPSQKTTENKADKSPSKLPASTSSSETSKPSIETIDTGLSPHEARIQKLKELLKKQEEAIDRLKEKRQKEIDDVRVPAVESSISEGLANKRESPFAVPLPPKKPRLEQYRSKVKETNTSVKDSFLPNTDDTQFVKLVGLEKVVDKLKAKKLQELKESQALNSENTTSL